MRVESTSHFLAPNSHSRIENYQCPCEDSSWDSKHFLVITDGQKTLLIAGNKFAYSHTQTRCIPTQSVRVWREANFHHEMGGGWSRRWIALAPSRTLEVSFLQQSSKWYRRDRPVACIHVRKFSFYFLSMYTFFSLFGLWEMSPLCKWLEDVVSAYTRDFNYNVNVQRFSDIFYILHQRSLSL